MSHCSPFGPKAPFLPVLEKCSVHDHPYPRSTNLFLCKKLVSIAGEGGKRYPHWWRIPKLVHSHFISLQLIFTDWAFICLHISLRTTKVNKSIRQCSHTCIFKNFLQICVKVVSHNLLETTYNVCLILYTSARQNEGFFKSIPLLKFLLCFSSPHLWERSPPWKTPTSIFVADNLRSL